jgi:hypothetical protein
MAWFPHFLSPWSGVIAAGVTVPSLLILYFLKLRRRAVAVSSTFLWRKAVQDLQVNSPFQKLRKNLLLLLQLLLLLALILAFARPVVNYTPPPGKLAVILIDHSASMNATDMPGGKTRLDEAKRQAKELVAGMPRGGQAIVIAFNDQAEIMQSFTGDADLLRRAIDDIEPTDRPTKLAEAYAVAQAKAAQSEAAGTNIVPEVWLYSDGRVEDAGDLRLDGTLKYQKIGTDTAGNIAITVLDARRNYEQPTMVQVFVTLADFGDKPVSTDVQLSVNGTPERTTKVNLVPARWSDPVWVAAHPGVKDDSAPNQTSANFTFEMQEAGTIKVEQMNKTGDCLAADDFAQVVVPAPKALSVLLVSPSTANDYLKKAMHSMGLKQMDTLPAEVYESDREKVAKNGTGLYDVVIFDRHYPTWLPPTGSFVYFGCAPRDGKLHVIPAGHGRYQTVKDVPVLDWRRDHPILRGISMGNLYAESMLRLAVPSSARVLVDGVKGPMVVLDREGSTTSLVIPFDLLQSSWPLYQMFPQFIYQMLQYLALEADASVRPSYSPGATVRVSRATLAKMGSDVSSIEIRGPGFDKPKKVPVPKDGELVLPSLNRVGIYKTDPPVPQFEQMAVNLLNANESNLLPVDTPPGSIGTAVAGNGPGRSRRELWWWLAVAAVPLLLVEWFVYTRRVHL